MSFEALIEKVKQAEGALEARERQGEADWRQFKSTWRSAWTPGRIVIAGLLSGFMIGRAQPARHVSAASTLRLLSALSGLLAVSRADDAATQASDAAAAAQEAVDTPRTPSSNHDMPANDMSANDSTHSVTGDASVRHDPGASVSTHTSVHDPRRASSEA